MITLVNPTKKEDRLLSYLEKCKAKEHSPTIGDVCRECHTTPKTLLGKTMPSIMRKIDSSVQVSGIT